MDKPKTIVTDDDDPDIVWAEERAHPIFVGRHFGADPIHEKNYIAASLLEARALEAERSGRLVEELTGNAFPEFFERAAELRQKAQRKRDGE